MGDPQDLNSTRNMSEHESTQQPSPQFGLPDSVVSSLRGQPVVENSRTSTDNPQSVDNNVNLLRGRSSASRRSVGSDSRRSVSSEPSVHEQVLLSTSFDPVDLLKEGLDEWQDRSLNLRLLKKSRTLRASRKGAFADLNEIINIEHSQQLTRGDTKLVDKNRLQGTSGVELGTQPGFVSYERIRSGRAASGRETQIMDPDDQQQAPKQLNAVTPVEYTSALEVAPHATLIHVIMMYHEILLKNGLLEDAERIANVLSELEYAENLGDGELYGMDLLLKDGLLNFLLRIQPYLPPIPKQVVKFKNLTYTANVMRETGYESLYTKAVGCLKGPLKKSSMESKTLLKDVTGYLMPGTLTLVLGPPGCGRSSFQRIIAGRPGTPKSKLEGEVTYNGKNVQDLNYQRLVAVVDQNDTHLAPLTVRETVEFSRDCTQFYRAKHFGKELLEIAEDLLKSGQDPKVETNLSMMGLKRVAGRPMIALTDDEKHRLSVAEMFSGTYAVYLFDQLNTGLDESLTFHLITSIRIFTRVRGIAVLASLLHPSSNVFDQFDRVIVLHGGEVVYQGPRQDVIPYFAKLGYVKPRHVSCGEFLEEVTTLDGVQYLQPGFPKLDLDGFVNAYRRSDTYKDICRVVNDTQVQHDLWVQGTHPLGLSFIQSHPNNGSGISGSTSTLVASISEKGGSLVDVSMDHTSRLQAGDEVVAVGGDKGMLRYVKVASSRVEFNHNEDLVRLQLERPLKEMKEAVQHGQFSRAYVMAPWPEFIHLLKRELKVTSRSRVSLFIRAFQVLVLGFFVGSMFFRVKTKPDQLDMNLKRTIFFVSLLDMTLFNSGQLPALVEERNIYYKQQGAHFYRPSSYLFAKLIGGLPFSLAEATTWTLIVYFLTGLNVGNGGWHFWVFYIIIVLTVLNGAALVRFVSAFASTRDAANSLMGVFTALFILFAGFLVPRFKIPKYWIWMFYIDPLQWGITSLLINEFNSDSYKTLCRDVPKLASIPQCAGRPDNTVGHAYLAKGQFYTSDHWIAVGIAVMFGWLILFTILTYFALARIRHLPTPILPPVREAQVYDVRKESAQGEDGELGSGSHNHKFSHLPQPITMSWHELSYDIFIPSIGKTHSILSYVSGWAEPGDMVGLVGCTGAGKTTLLNCLAGRKVALGRVGGQIYINGYLKSHSTFARVAGYVENLGAYSPYMTIRESISFSAALEHRDLTSQQRCELVNEILELMELSMLENILVQSLGTSLMSKAQSTRLAIAVEMARNPSVLFVDEVTRGLDSRGSNYLMRSLKNISNTGRIVIAAIQVPGQRALSYFTTLQILRRGGETVYFGAVGKEGELVRAYFEAIPGTPVCPPDTSIAAYAIDVIGDGVVDRKSLKDFSFEYRVSDLALNNHIQLQRYRRSKGLLGSELVNVSKGANPLSRALEIFKKLQRHYWRNIPYSWGRMIGSVINALLLGSVFFSENIHSTQGMNIRSNAIFISTVLISLSNAQAVLPQVFVQKQIYAREKANKHYDNFLYNLCWTLAEIPYALVSSLIYTAILLAMVQMSIDSASHFFRYWFIVSEISLAITFLGMFLAIASPLPQIAAVLVTIIVGFWIATCGVVVTKRKILHQYIWIFWTNPLQYAIHALTVTTFYCDTGKPECLNNGLNPQCLRDQTACPQCTCPRLNDSLGNNIFVWNQISVNRSLKHAQVPYDILVLFLFCVLFRAMTLLAIKARERMARR